MKKTLIGIGIVGLLFFSIYRYLVYKYYEEFNNIKTEFENIKQVEKVNLEVGNFDSTIEEISADLILKDGTEMGFGSSIYLSSFQDTSYVYVKTFNNWKFQIHNFRKIGEKEEYFHDNSLNFGKSGELNKYINVRINNIIDAINNHKEIERLINEIPEYPNMIMIEFDRGLLYKHTEFIYKLQKNKTVRYKEHNFEFKSDSLRKNSKTLKTAHNNQ